MTPVPLELPLRPSEAAELGNLIFDHAERKPLTDEVRNRIAARAPSLRLESITPYFGSLDRDPVHPSVYYLAVDGDTGEPLLLHVALATAPTSSIFYKPLLIGRMRRANGPEMVINAIPFGPSDHENLDKFCTRIDGAFLPRPQGSRASIAVSGDPAAEILPEAFHAFRTILKRTGRNLAAIHCTDWQRQREFYYAGLWAAIRAGWREGYSATAEIPMAAESIREAAAFSIFRLNLAPLCLPAVADAEAEIQRLALRFEPALQAVERMQELIRQARSSLKSGRSFDVEISLEGSGTATTAKELTFCLDWLKSRGHAAQLVSPDLGSGAPEAEHLKELSGVARQYHATLSLRGADREPETLDRIVKATVGRIQLRISAGPSAIREFVSTVAEHIAG